MILPKMLLREHKSAIISISSLCGEYPMGNFASYAASKAFNDLFSRSLYYEFD